ncbi:MULTISPECIES: SHOCT domain-containing protein [unclassified Enterococcus]|uniref:SHOCT domain-containing protein n=1 Tax=unclassified Enterococcus TaxID=2608891 RepID=UPI0015519761|nr:MULTISPECIES: SHOCT domain-containing protein [unclassified Enterococcus]MBS7577629.1 SHOCT domain-containing protein [Enterococcus sp. MMGLQ5-2]MBS7584177.1 SHOCT domain-containing protein [Enterococcus sp. MMGLQ5-1]NPD12035.1 SHOCT domain-containing protein [Enterococcus sp. MMGLQ5-1]NPD37462.1 SHOCT domain-containing protein [Enterococcus sp. MMGLQ5-2]
MEKEYIFKSNAKAYIKILDDKIIITKKGLLNAINQGLKGEKTIFIKNISAIQVKKNGLTTGYLQFSLIGGGESKGGVTAAVKDENTILFNNKKEYNQALEIKEYIENLISVGEHHISQEKSIPEQLKEYKELADIGIITKEEFDLKKKELLNL